jgi:hypothetical protein
MKASSKWSSPRACNFPANPHKMRSALPARTHNLKWRVKVREGKDRISRL